MNHPVKARMYESYNWFGFRKYEALSQNNRQDEVPSTYEEIKNTMKN